MSDVYLNSVSEQWTRHCNYRYLVIHLPYYDLSRICHPVAQSLTTGDFLPWFTIMLSRNLATVWLSAPRIVDLSHLLLIWLIYVKFRASFSVPLCRLKGLLLLIGLWVCSLTTSDLLSWFNIVSNWNSAKVWFIAFAHHWSYSFWPGDQLVSLCMQWVCR